MNFPYEAKLDVLSGIHAPLTVQGINMAPKGHAKGDAATAVDDSVVAECRRLQALAYEGVRKHLGSSCKSLAWLLQRADHHVLCT